MAGIYLHIPFCKQACHYCNFHFSTSMRSKDEMIKAICKEIEIQKDYLLGEEIATIYFGGGTPSVLSQKDIDSILDTIHQYHKISKDAEISLEANPDDLTTEKLEAFSKSPINRLSIGIQSFFDEDLKFMNRAHSANEAETCVHKAQSFGFQDISIDLIYGSPTTSHKMWEENLVKTMRLEIPHISSYCMTVEPGTALDHFVKKGTSEPVDEVKSALQFQKLMQFASDHDYDHYEISNFAKKGRYSRHNTAYWQGKKYLGLGPSAHSFNGLSRQWNIPHNVKYMQGILNENQVPSEQEILNKFDIYNEYVMTSLRTQWGVNLHQIQDKFKAYFITKCKEYIEADQMIIKNGKYILTQKGKLIADRIAMELFWVED